MRAAIKELQTLEAAPAVAEKVVEEVTPEPEEEKEEDGGDQQALIASLLAKRDELLRMQVRKRAPPRSPWA